VASTSFRMPFLRSSLINFFRSLMEALVGTVTKKGAASSSTMHQSLYCAFAALAARGLLVADIDGPSPIARTRAPLSAAQPLSLPQARPRTPCPSSSSSLAHVERDPAPSVTRDRPSHRAHELSSTQAKRERRTYVRPCNAHTTWLVMPTKRPAKPHTLKSTCPDPVDAGPATLTALGNPSGQCPQRAHCP
jgi:hypothetical protein